MLKVYKMDFLVALYVFCILTAELLGVKTFPLLAIGTFKLNASVAIFVLPIIFTINDIITEVYGKERTKSVIRSALMMVFFIFLFAMFATLLPPSTRFAPLEESYDKIFGISARIAAASLTAFVVSEFVDVFVFVKIRQRFHAKALWFRNNVSNFVAQFFDTTIFMFLAFYDPKISVNGNLAFLVSLILPYWLLKCSASVVETPFVYLGVKWLRKSSDKNIEN